MSKGLRDVYATLIRMWPAGRDAACFGSGTSVRTARDRSSGAEVVRIAARMAEGSEAVIFVASIESFDSCFLEQNVDKSVHAPLS